MKENRWSFYKKSLNFVAQLKYAHNGWGERTILMLYRSAVSVMVIREYYIEFNHRKMFTCSYLEWRSIESLVSAGACLLGRLLVHLIVLFPMPFGQASRLIFVWQWGRDASQKTFILLGDKLIFAKKMFIENDGIKRNNYCLSLSHKSHEWWYKMYMWFDISKWKVHNKM